MMHLLKQAGAPIFVRTGNTQGTMYGNKITTIVLLAAIGAFLFIPFLGRVHLFDWDEINFAECAREMILLDDYSRIYINFKPFPGKAAHVLFGCR